VRYKVKVPIGKKVKGPGYKVGEVVNDGDLPAETIEIHVGNGFLVPIPDKKTAAKKTAVKDEVNNG
jgi:hypothetical protein